MSEQTFEPKPTAFSLATKAFERAYNPSSNMNIGSSGMLETLVGVLEDGTKIRLLKAALIHEETFPVPFLHAEVQFRAKAGETAIPGTYNRRYMFGEDEDNGVYEIVDPGGIVTIKVGPGEADDLRSRIESADFSMQP